jgi:hypothetical protein
LAPDYGLDGIVEVFDECGVASGHLFFVQLKATDDTSIEKSLDVRLDTRTLNYYSLLVLPVLLTVFHSPTQALYARWVDKSPPARGAKSATFRLSVGDKWGPDRFDSIVRDLEFVRTATKVGDRAQRIEQYYFHRRFMNPADKSSDPPHQVYRFNRGEKVLHGVFGLGTVDQESENYLFVRFDDDEMVRKFNPGDTWEFTRLDVDPLSETL